MDEPRPNPDAVPTAPQPTAGPTLRLGRVPLIFAIVGVVVALASSGLYLFRQPAETQRLTPETIVDRFLAAVFLANSAERLGEVVCSNWNPADALTRTSDQVGADARVSWDEIRVVSGSEKRTTLRARIGLRFRDDIRPSAYQQWRFSLVDENGWRVCEARPFVV